MLGFKLPEDTQVRAMFTGRVTQEVIRKFIQLLEASLDTFPTKAAANAQETHESDDRDPLTS
jgi:hypothetical protein